jgi:hypothetical protein
LGAQFNVIFVKATRYGIRIDCIRRQTLASRFGKL